jgi:malonyl-CoA decarboxylase
MEGVESAIQKFERHHQPHSDSSPEQPDLLPKSLVEDLSNLEKALKPFYEECFALILRQNAVDGMELLVSVREDLMQLQTYCKGQNDVTSEVSSLLPQLQDLDRHLQSVFTTWFVPGMLELRRITYQQTSASVIEFISMKEAVHPMKSLEDLRRRLGPRRRVFALFHPLLPDRPLVFVHIALIDSEQGEKVDPISLIPSSMKDVMDVDQQDGNFVLEQFSPKVATFYSISNGVKGLAGVGLGEFLLKQAIQSMRTELPSLKVFVTLSPIPGFRKWLQVKLEQHRDESLISPLDFQRLVECGLISCSNETVPLVDLWKNLEKENFALFHQDCREDHEDTVPEHDSKVLVLREVLSKLACRYLAQEKHRGKPLDGVCKFHVGNGALLHDVHFAADSSRIGMNNSFGMMCNYLYDLEQLEHNSANFETNYTVPISENIQKWLSHEEEF